VLDERRRRLSAIADAVADARRRVDQVRNQHDQVILDEQSVTKQLSALRIDVADLAARLGTPVAVAEDGPEALGRGVAELRRAWDKETADLDAARLAARADAGDAAAERKEMLAGLDVDGEFAAALGAAGATVEHLAVGVARDEAEVAAGADLRAERDRLTAVKARYQRISTDLTDSRFVRFLLDDERARLADIGSDHFSRLSSGRYRFTDDGSFAIVDLTAADAERKASSLSGGETFLASLALALSLAEMVARTGGRLDAFFLDEGFGSLDPEHLDLAMEGIEALVADDATRLVVVVSHVPELRYRIEDLIELDRHPLTGDTKVVRS
jgi:exonuclease SbcC